MKPDDKVHYSKITISKRSNIPNETPNQPSNGYQYYKWDNMDHGRYNVLTLTKKGQESVKNSIKNPQSPRIISTTSNNPERNSPKEKPKPKIGIKVNINPTVTIAGNNKNNTKYTRNINLNPKIEVPRYKQQYENGRKNRYDRNKNYGTHVKSKSYYTERT